MLDLIGSFLEFRELMIILKEAKSMTHKKESMIISLVSIKT